jgi:microcystin-dependent protein
MSLWKWSKTAASNATADPSINRAEGMAPSAVNDSARAEMAAVAKYRDDISGALLTSGSSTAYTITSNQSFDTLAHLDGAMIAFTPHATNGAAATLSVDGLTAKPLRLAPSLGLVDGVLILGTPYVATYNNTNGEFILHGVGGNPYCIPLGGFLISSVSTPPNSAFVKPYGQAISRTTYASYFSAVSTAFGTGDGSTTFNVPDVAGRIFAINDSLSGSAAGRITTAGSGVDGSTLGSAGGAQNKTIDQTNLPNVTLTTTIASGQGSHTHTASANGSAYFDGSNQSGRGYNVGGFQGGTLAITNTAATLPAMTGTTPLGGSGTALTIVPPIIVMNAFLRII